MSDVPACCKKIYFHEGTPEGSYKNLYGLETYTAGTPGKKVIVCLTDVFGNKLKNMQLLADRLAKLGGGEFYVLVPDILKNDLLDPEGLDKIGAWFPNHDPVETDGIVAMFVEALKLDLKPEFVGAIGYCYGGRMTIDGLSNTPIFDAGCVAHPSLVNNVELFHNLVKPILFSCAETDGMFPAEVRRPVEDYLLEKKIPFQSTLFQGTVHGFAVKGDYTDSAVAYAANKALQDHIDWFIRWSSAK